VARAKAKKRKVRRHNPAATLLRTPAYRPRVVKSKRAYSRKKPPVRDGADT
jgi:stalled ribosome alternative rescue factor ArfA